MPTFRPDLVAADLRPISDAVVYELCATTTHPANFFAAPPMRLANDHRADEESFWELFHGRLLDDTQTRERRRFAAWNVHVLDADGQRSGEPVVALKYDAAAGHVHITRAVLCHAHEVYDAGRNVLQTREVQRWQRELVGTIRLPSLRDAGALRDELACRLFQAVVGASRLPLTSLETPLPGFALGQLGYFHGPAAVAANAGPMTTPAELTALAADVRLAGAERVKHLELLLRSVPAGGIAKCAVKYVDDCRREHGAVEAVDRLRAVFNAVTLSPYTSFAKTALAFVAHLAEHGRITTADRVDFLAHLVRQLGRHLAAYDLVTFHHRGANYPDALLLDDLLAELLPLAEQHPTLFTGDDGPRSRLWRGAVRQGLSLRRQYAAHPVPDAPTSPGENLRVLPAPFVRVSDEQIYSPAARSRRLFSTEPPVVSADILRCSFHDLDDPAELRELGTALFLDRPLGWAKAPGEPDQTLLMSHVLFSRSLAEQRLRQLARSPELQAESGRVDSWLDALRQLAVDGLSLTAAGPPPRPGVVSLHDARRVADDFVILRTTRQTLADFAAQYDLSALMASAGDIIPPLAEWRLLVPGGADDSPTLGAYDRHLRLRLEMAADLSRGYDCRGGAEYPAVGLRVLCVWGLGGSGVAEAFNLRDQDVVLLPR